MFKRYIVSFALAALTLGFAVPAMAVPYDAPTVVANAVGHGKIHMTITAGASGAPDGIGVYWMTYEDYSNYGDVWPSTLSYPGLNWAFFTGSPTLNTFDRYTTFALGPFETVEVEIGDLADETGLTTNNDQELTDGTDWVLCTFAKAGSGFTQSAYSQNIAGMSTLQGENCTYTQGYWKTHGAGACHSGNNADDWDTNNLTLGTVNYNATELCSILNQNVGGNGLVSLAHQLIAAKLNIASGALPGAAVLTCINNADALIGNLVVPPVGGGFLAPATTSALTQCLDNFNNGLSGVPHCPSTPSKNSSWGRLKTLYR